MSTSSTHPVRVLSGMRATGKLHLGHYHGAIKNWVTLQHKYECFFSVADWHALTTHYQDPSHISKNVWDVVIDWLAAGINPGSAHIFIQSDVPEVAELHLLLSMSTPLSWLERVPSYKDQQENIKDRDLGTYGFLGYPLLQTADILSIKGTYVPVGEDQAPHVEISREIARRFNGLYGKDDDFVEKAEAAVAKMGKKNAKLYLNLKRQFQEEGNHDARDKCQALVEDQMNISVGDKERLLGFIEGAGKLIFPEPEVLLTPDAKLPGLDGRKMSKSYGNTIGLREAPDEIGKKIKTMQTDPARVKRTDPGTPEKCPVWELHKVYSSEDVQKYAYEGCKSAGIGCLDCKAPLISAIQEEVAPFRERAQQYLENPSLVRSIVAEGTEAAREVAKETLAEVREAMGLEHKQVTLEDA